MNNGSLTIENYLWRANFYPSPNDKLVSIMRRENSAYILYHYMNNATIFYNDVDQHVPPAYQFNIRI
jgi:hypothetical protein